MAPPPPLRLEVVGLTENAADSLIKFQMVPEDDAPPVADDLHITLKVNKADNTLTIIDSGAGMANQGLADIVRNISRGIVRRVVVRPNHNNGCQHSSHISRDDDAEQLHKGTEITLSLDENEDLVKKECVSIYLKVEKEPELNVNREAEAGAKDPNVILCKVKEHLREKVKDAIMAEPGSFEADMPCRIKDRILEMNPNNEKVKQLIKMVERGDTIELAVDLLYDNAIILNKQKKSVWKRMTDRLFTCVINQAAGVAFAALESDLCGGGDALPVE